MTRHTKAACAAVLLITAACAHAPHGPRLADGSPPQLLGCGSYTMPSETVTQANHFWIEVTVTPAGTVPPGSGRRSLSHREHGSDLSTAVRLAESCRFTPAEKDGVPVEGQAVVDVAF